MFDCEYFKLEWKAHFPKTIGKPIFVVAEYFQPF